MNAAPSKPAESVGAGIARGAAWMVLFKLLERSIGFVSTLILARLLVPADFGLIAMAMSLVAMTELMSAFGFDIALIQRQDATRQHYDTAWTYNVLLGVAVAVILLALTVPAASFFREPRLVSIIPVLAVASLAEGFQNIGVVTFRKEMHFDREFRFLLGKRVVSFAVTIALALSFRSYWALIGGIVTGKMFGVAMSYMLHPYRPRFCLAAGRDLFHFSKWLLANNVIHFLQSRSTDFVLGRTLGAHTLGVYNVAFEIATLPSTELVAPLNRAVLPGYATIATDMTRLRREFLRVVGIVTIFIFPAGVGLASVADPAVRLLLGEKWTDAIPLVQIIAVYGTISALQSNAGQVFFALGKPKLITLLSGCTLVVFLPSLLYASIHYGAIGAASMFFAFSLTTTPIVHAVFFRISGMPATDYLAVIWRPAVSAAAMGVAIFVLRRYLAAGDTLPSLLAELLICVLFGASSYCACLLSMWSLSGRPEGAEAVVLATLRKRLPATLFASFKKP